MQTYDLIIKNMKCCLENDDHVVQEAIMIRCGGNACKNCIYNSNKSTIKCFYCNEYHQKTELLKMPSNYIFQKLIENKYFKNLAVDFKRELIQLISDLTSKN
jgi:hypothetical protein